MIGRASRARIQRGEQPLYLTLRAARRERVEMERARRRAEATAEAFAAARETLRSAARAEAAETRRAETRRAEERAAERRRRDEEVRRRDEAARKRKRAEWEAQQAAYNRAVLEQQAAQAQQAAAAVETPRQRATRVVIHQLFRPVPPRSHLTARQLAVYRLNTADYPLSLNSTRAERRRHQRGLGLLIHPDKCDHDRATEAFQTMQTHHDAFN